MKITKEQELYAWPPQCRLSFYDGRLRFKFSTTDRLFDLSGNLMLDWNKKSRTIYLGVSTKSTKWIFCEEQNISKIESHIRYDISCDGYYVTINRLSEIDDSYCTEELLWKLRIRTCGI